MTGHCVIVLYTQICQLVSCGVEVSHVLSLAVRCSSCSVQGSSDLWK